MTAASLKHYRRWLQDYVAGFEPGHPRHKSNLELKINHSLRVWRESQNVCSSLNLSGRIYHLASLAALFHDIGRFQQYYAYRTFNDKSSIDHGLLGFKILRKQDIINDLPAGDRKKLLFCVLNHNRLRIPAGLPSEVDLLLRILRDSDKLDIMFVLINHFNQGGPEEVTLNLRNHPARFSSRVVEQILSGNIVNYEDMVWINDFKLLLCSWVYDLNFAYSRQAVWQRGYLQELLESLPAEASKINKIKSRLYGKVQASI